MKRDTRFTYIEVARIFGVSEEAVLEWMASGRLGTPHGDHFCVTLAAIDELMGRLTASDLRAARGP